MHAIWQGIAPPSGQGGTLYAHVCNILGSAQQGSENNGGFFGAKCSPLSDAIVITKLTAYVTNAPTTGFSWTFTLRKNASTDTAATVTISDANTSASWSGSVSYSQLDLISMKITAGGGTPPNSGNVYWTIEYDSVGSDYFLVPGSIAGVQNFTQYWNPFGGMVNSSYTVATDPEIVVPTACTVTKIAGSTITAPSSGAYPFYVRKNNTTDSSFFANVVPGSPLAVSSAGSLSFAAGDQMVMKVAPTAGDWLSLCHCITVVPSTPGEVICAFGNANVLAGGTTYASPYGGGTMATWDTTESNVYERMSACTLSKLYVRLGTAAGPGLSWAITLRDAVADTAITTTLPNTTTANDTIDTATHAEGNFVSIKSVSSGGTPANTRSSISFVQKVPQPSSPNNFFAMF